MDMWQSCIKVFQSTLPRGERRFCSRLYHHLRAISIHAPTRGATRLHLPIEIQRDISIHAPTRGATRWDDELEQATPDFNPRSHEGSDPELLESKEEVQYFNPRSHEGSDPARHCSRDRSRQISIHAPTRGATRAIS